RIELRLCEIILTAHAPAAILPEPLLRRPATHDIDLATARAERSDVQLHFDVAEKRHADAASETEEAGVRLPCCFPIVEITITSGSDGEGAVAGALQFQIGGYGEARINSVGNAGRGGHEISIRLEAERGVKGLRDVGQFGFDTEHEETRGEAA